MLGIYIFVVFVSGILRFMRVMTSLARGCCQLVNGFRHGRAGHRAQDQVPALCGRFHEGVSATFGIELSDVIRVCSTVAKWKM